MSRHSRGFTIIELLFIIVLLLAASLIFFVQRQNVVVAANDNQRKTAINAMYYGLEEVYYAQHQSYPETIDSATLPSVDPTLFTDPDGNTFGTPQSEYHYESVNCTNNQCKSYTLRATLQGEADYVKSSRHS